ncbi:MAG: response regulator transcription factor [Spartobacteria bacterium]|nr:response regulator transcription factor [Spartobacteria bacterium]
MRILVVEDDLKVAASIEKGLNEAGWSVLPVHSAEAAEAAMPGQSFDGIVLDLGLPGKDGITFLKELRERGDVTPVLILTARDGIENRVDGLDAGADDYLVKPFAFAELMARLRAVERRTKGRDVTQITLRDLDIDLIGRTVTRNGDEIELTQREFDLLVYLAQARGEVVSREMLTRDVWKISSRATPMDNIIDVHISHLRDKIDKPYDTRLLQTIRGVGFALRDTP